MTYMVPLWSYRRGILFSTEEEIMLPFNPARKIRRTKKRPEGWPGKLVNRIRKIIYR